MRSHTLLKLLPHYRSTDNGTTNIKTEFKFTVDAKGLHMELDPDLIEFDGESFRLTDSFRLPVNPQKQDSIRQEAYENAIKAIQFYNKLCKTSEEHLVVNASSLQQANRANLALHQANHANRMLLDLPHPSALLDYTTEAENTQDISSGYDSEQYEPGLVQNPKSHTKRATSNFGIQSLLDFENILNIKPRRYDDWFTALSNELNARPFALEYCRFYKDDKKEGYFVFGDIVYASNSIYLQDFKSETKKITKKMKNILPKDLAKRITTKDPREIYYVIEAVQSYCGSIAALAFVNKTFPFSVRAFLKTRFQVLHLASASGYTELKLEDSDPVYRDQFLSFVAVDLTYLGEYLNFVYLFSPRLFYEQINSCFSHSNVSTYSKQINKLEGHLPLRQFEKSLNTLGKKIIESYNGEELKDKLDAYFKNVYQTMYSFLQENQAIFDNAETTLSLSDFENSIEYPLHAYFEVEDKKDEYRLYCVVETNENSFTGYDVQRNVTKNFQYKFPYKDCHPVYPIYDFKSLIIQRFRKNITRPLRKLVNKYEVNDAKRETTFLPHSKGKQKVKRSAAPASSSSSPEPLEKDEREYDELGADEDTERKHEEERALLHTLRTLQAYEDDEEEARAREQHSLFMERYNELFNTDDRYTTAEEKKAGAGSSTMTNDEVDKECCMCFYPSNVVLKPCDHYQFCNVCASKLMMLPPETRKCPLCTTPIQYYEPSTL